MKWISQYQHSNSTSARCSRIQGGFSALGISGIPPKVTNWPSISSPKFRRRKRKIIDGQPVPSPPTVPREYILSEQLEMKLKKSLNSISLVCFVLL